MWKLKLINLMISPNILVTEQINEDETDSVKRGNELGNNNKNHDFSQCPIGFEIGTIVEDVKHIREEQKENFSELKSSITELTNTLINPTTGLIIKVQNIEKTRAIASKWVWGIIIAVSSAAVVSLFKIIF